VTVERLVVLSDHGFVLAAQFGGALGDKTLRARY
jgi:hypothetical protein